MKITVRRFRAGLPEDDVCDGVVNYAVTPSGDLCVWLDRLPHPSAIYARGQWDLVTRSDGSL